MRKFLYMLAALLVLIGINTHDVEARTDVYATTYNGNSWYVDQDSVKRVGDVLNLRCTLHLALAIRYHLAIVTITMQMYSTITTNSFQTMANLYGNLQV